MVRIQKIAGSNPKVQTVPPLGQIWPTLPTENLCSFDSEWSEMSVSKTKCHVLKVLPHFCPLGSKLHLTRAFKWDTV